VLSKAVHVCTNVKNSNYKGTGMLDELDKMHDYALGNNKSR